MRRQLAKICTNSLRRSSGVSVQRRLALRFAYVRKACEDIAMRNSVSCWANGSSPGRSGSIFRPSSTLGGARASGRNGLRGKSLLRKREMSRYSDSLWAQRILRVNGWCKDAKDERDRLEIANFELFEGTVGFRLRLMIKRLEEERAVIWLESVMSNRHDVTPVKRVGRSAGSLTLKRVFQQRSLEAILVDLQRPNLRLPCG
jgi:hypothetical protein